MSESVKVAYLIQFPVGQLSVPVGDVPAMIAKAMHPRDWNFWEGREALFDQLLARVWHRVGMSFSGQLEAAKEVRSILESQNESPLVALLQKLSGHNFYQLYLAGIHNRLLVKAVADGALALIDSAPLSPYPVKQDDFGMMEFRSTDRVKLADLGKHLRPYGVMIDEVGISSGGEETPGGKRRVPVDEKRGKIILRVVTAMDLDPENLPAYRSGHSTVKAKIRAQVREVALTDFAPDDDLEKFDKAFDRAWSWLIKNKRINHPKADC